MEREQGDILKNHSCGRLETEEGDVLIRYLQENLGSDRVHFYTGVQYRHLLVVKGGDKRAQQNVCFNDNEWGGNAYSCLLHRGRP